MRATRRSKVLIPGSKYLVCQHPRSGPVNQQTRPIIARPTQRIKPARQTKSGAGIISQFPETAGFPDQCRMAFPGASKSIGRQRRHRSQSGLCGHSFNHDTGNIIKPGWKYPKEPGDAGLESKTQTIMAAAQLLDDFLISRIKVEVSSGLRPIGNPIEASVPRTLRVTKKPRRHSHIPQISRGRFRPRGINRLSIAKYRCERRGFCDRFCDTSKGAA